MESDAKLKMNGKYVCEVTGNGETSGKDCLWHYNDKKFMFKLKNPKDIHKSTFSCEISKIKPFPVETKTGPPAKLFQGMLSTRPVKKKICFFTHGNHFLSFLNLNGFYFKVAVTLWHPSVVHATTQRFPHLYKTINLKTSILF